MNDTVERTSYPRVTRYSFPLDASDLQVISAIQSYLSQSQGRTSQVTAVRWAIRQAALQLRAGGTWPMSGDESGSGNG